MYQLRRIEDTAEIPIMAGPIVGTNMAKGRDYVKVYGKDWMEYLNRRQIPFDPEDKTLYRFGGTTVTADHPPAGYAYHEGSRDVALIVSDILTQVMGRPNSLPITESLSAVGIRSTSLLAWDQPKLCCLLLMDLVNTSPALITEFRMTESLQCGVHIDSVIR